MKYTVKKKKGDTSIMFILSVFITIIGIMIVFLLFSSMPGPRKVLCSVLTPLRHSFIKTPSFCEEKIEITPLPELTITVKEFFVKNGEGREFVRLRFGDVKEEKHLVILVPINSKVEDASFTIKNTLLVEKNFFTEEEPNKAVEEKEITMDGSVKSVWINVSNNTVINSVVISISNSKDEKVENVSVVLSLNLTPEENHSLFFKKDFDYGIIKLNKTMIKRINEYIELCSKEGNKECSIKFLINSTQGRIKINNIITTYYKNSFGINLTIFDLNNENHKNITFDLIGGEERKINIKEEVQARINKTMKEGLKGKRVPCNVRIPITIAAKNTSLDIKDLNVKLKVSDLKGLLLEKIIDCWGRAVKGFKTESFSCDEISIPRSFVFCEPINEKNITSLLNERKLCHIIQNSDFDCGTHDNIRFNNVINSSTNVLIRYDAKKKQVVVE